MLLATALSSSHLYLSYLLLRVTLHSDSGLVIAQGSLLLFEETYGDTQYTSSSPVEAPSSQYFFSQLRLMSGTSISIAWSPHIQLLLYPHLELEFWFIYLQYKFFFIL
jgi:hypothetical protein